MAEEKNFENRIKNYLHSIGCYPAGFPEDKMNMPQIGWYFKVWGGGFQKAGIPDLICCIKGRFIAIEVKASTGRASELQKLNTNRIRDSGGDAVILFPSGFEQFKEDLNHSIEALKYDSYFPPLEDEYK